MKHFFRNPEKAKNENYSFLLLVRPNYLFKKQKEKSLVLSKKNLQGFRPVIKPRVSEISKSIHKNIIILKIFRISHLPTR